jgi:hypothetical protein
MSIDQASRSSTRSRAWASGRATPTSPTTSSKVGVRPRATITTSPRAQAPGRGGLSQRRTLAGRDVRLPQRAARQPRPGAELRLAVEAKPGPRHPHRRPGAQDPAPAAQRQGLHPRAGQLVRRLSRSVHVHRQVQVDEREQRRSAG